MNNAPEYLEALAELEEMFPTEDEESLRAVRWKRDRDNPPEPMSVSQRNYLAGLQNSAHVYVSCQGNPYANSLNQQSGLGQQQFGGLADFAADGLAGLLGGRQ